MNSKEILSILVKKYWVSNTKQLECTKQYKFGNPRAMIASTTNCENSRARINTITSMDYDLQNVSAQMVNIGSQCASQL
jgi:hypothetical protein